MAYVDGFVLPVPKKKLGAYWKMARLAGKVWKDHGAVDYVECVADDVKSASARRSRAASSSSAARSWCSPTSSTSRAPTVIAA